MSETTLRDVLAFYANPDNYAFNTEGEIGPNVILDGGSKARMILDDADALGQTPLQAAALAALVAWRTNLLRMKMTKPDSEEWAAVQAQWCKSDDDVKYAADRLIAHNRRRRPDRRAGGDLVTKLQKLVVTWRYWQLQTQAAEGTANWAEYHDQFLAAERELEDAADRLAAREAK